MQGKEAQCRWLWQVPRSVRSRSLLQLQSEKLLADFGRKLSPTLGCHSTGFLRGGSEPCSGMLRRSHSTLDLNCESFVSLTVKQEE